MNIVSETETQTNKPLNLLDILIFEIIGFDGYYYLMGEDIYFVPLKNNWEKVYEIGKGYKCKFGLPFITLNPEKWYSIPRHEFVLMI